MIFKKQDLIEIPITIKKESNVYIVELNHEFCLECVNIVFSETYNQDLKVEILEKGKFKGIGTYHVCNENLSIELDSEVTTSRIRLIKSNNSNFNIKTMSIYRRKYPCLVIAARSDGLGARLLPLINAFILSKLTGAKFGFVWRARNGSGISPFFNITLESEQVIFSRDFCKEHSYTEVLPPDKGYSQEIPLDLLTKPPFQYKWGWYISYVLKKISYKKEGNLCKRAWQEIGFSSKIRSSINRAFSEANKLGDFVAIHVRCSDIIFNGGGRWNSYYFKVMPAEIAMELIESNIKQTIVLFGDYFDELKELKERYTQTHRIFLIEEFIEDLDYTERLFFEISFMSRAKEIYASGSSFSKTASIISGRGYPKFYYKLYDSVAMYKIIQKHFCKLEICQQNVYKAFILYFLFEISGSLDTQIRTAHIMESITYDPRNSLLINACVKHCVENHLFDEALKCISDIKFDEEFFYSYFKANLHALDISNEISILATKYPKNAKILALNLWLSKTDKSPTPQPKTITKEVIKEKPIPSIYLVSAKDRIHNHLAYKLGKALILNSKSLLGYIRMPYVLSYIKEAHQKEQKEYQTKITKNPKLKLPKLESYPDYKEALKEKQCFTYKLGQALIAANSVRGGGAIFAYLAFFKEVRRLRRGLKEQRK